MWYDSAMAWLLHSPMHGMLSKNFMLVTVAGRKSGKAYTTPVNYSREGNTLTVVSQRDRTWWRNLRGQRPVTLYLQGKNVPGSGTVIEEAAGVAQILADYLQKNPQLAKYFSVALDTSGQPQPDQVTRAAQDRVMIQIKLG